MPDLVTRAPRHSGRLWSLLVAAIAIGGLVVVGLHANWGGVAAVERFAARAIWLLPALVVFHLGQLFLVGVAWACLFTGPRPGIWLFFRLRVVREGVDLLLPVAHVGGEIVGARLLARAGVALNRAAASVVVDVTIELATQIMFLATGLGALAILSHQSAWRIFGRALLGSAVVAGAFALAQRGGLLRLLESLARAIERRWPALNAGGLQGLHAAALAFYRQPGPLFYSTLLHLVGWMTGSIETWLVLRAAGIAVSPLQAFTIESLGMAARSAGFAVPAALGVQDGGFVLACAAVGVPVAPALALTVLKRIREVLVGLIGLVLWHFEKQAPPINPLLTPASD